MKTLAKGRRKKCTLSVKVKGTLVNHRIAQGWGARCLVLAVAHQGGVYHIWRLVIFSCNSLHGFFTMGKYRVNVVLVLCATKFCVRLLQSSALFYGCGALPSVATLRKSNLMAWIADSVGRGGRWHESVELVVERAEKRTMC
jgi:hypothetical protein